MLTNRTNVPLVRHELSVRFETVSLSNSTASVGRWACRMPPIILSALFNLHLREIIMNFELLVLRSHNAVEHDARTFGSKTLHFALQSFNGDDYSGGSFAQMTHVLYLKRRKEGCAEFCRSFKRAFSALNSIQRKLLYAAYVKNVNRKKLCQATGLKAVELNARLYRARKAFKSKLIACGFTPEWVRSLCDACDLPLVAPLPAA